MNDAFWKGGGQPSGRILFGRLGEENAKHPGTYRFTSTEGFSVPDAHILSPDMDAQGNGENTKPTAGSYCVAAMTTNGAQCFIIGFHVVAKMDEKTDDPPSVGNPDDNATSADKVFRTAGGASLILKRGGAVIIEGGPGTGVILNPVNNQMTLRSTNFGHVVDGYTARLGRKEPDKTNPKTVHEEMFLHQVGPTFDRVTIANGDLEDDARRQLTVESVAVAASEETALTKTRETYYSDGKWVGEGPKYQWGGDGADQAMVLGNKLVEVIGKLIDIIRDLKVGTAFGPSTPPLPPTTVDLENLRAQLSDMILSSYLFVSKDPATP